MRRLHLSASVLVTEVPELQLYSYDAGQQADSVMCVGETVTVTASLDAYQLENGAYSLSWSLLDDLGAPSDAAEIIQFGDSSVIVHALAAGGQCGVASFGGMWCRPRHGATHRGRTPTPTTTPCCPASNSISYCNPVYMQCLEDTLVLQYNAPWASEVNISALALDVVDVVDVIPPHVGNLMWLSAGENLSFDVEYISNEGCVY